MIFNSTKLTCFDQQNVIGFCNCLLHCNESQHWMLLRQTNPDFPKTVSENGEYTGGLQEKHQNESKSLC